MDINFKQIKEIMVELETVNVLRDGFSDLLWIVT